MYNSDLADQIENAVENALVTSDFSKLNKSITTAVNTSIAQIGTNQHRFYQQYENDETTMEQLEHVDGEIVNGDARADFTARRRAARAEEERARYNSRQAQEARRQAAETRRREEAARRQQARRQSAQNGTPRGSAHRIMILSTCGRQRGKKAISGRTGRITAILRSSSAAIRQVLSRSAAIRRDAWPERC